VALLKLINPQGIVGLAVAAILTALLIAAKVDVRHWKGQSATFEQLYRAEAKAHAGTIANYRVAAEKARAADAANAERVKAEADKIYRERDNAFEKRIADARARAGSLQQGRSTGADQGGRGTAAMPDHPGAAAGADQAAGQGGFSDADRLIATEQAIQLDELIKWVRSIVAIDTNGGNDAK
jgi:hypothetical protein